jgi:protein-S-isoprenylcysteine O-methyltransferase Ste14
MSASTLFNTVLIVWVAIAALTIPYLMFVAAPYGRHVRKGWGPTLNNRLGWILMELPSPVLVLTFFIIGPHNQNITAWVFLLMWQSHYIYRTFIFPALIRGGKDARMPVMIMGSAVLFNLVNGSMQGSYLFNLSGGYATDWLLDPRFIGGLILFVTGYAVHAKSDAILRKLRKPGEAGYKIPTGGLYRYISCPNYFGEMIEWCGFALATWSISGAAFAFWTAANLLPRALMHHRWYHEKFADYPAERKAVIPFVL